jgi:hypothetical protein
LIQVTVRPNGFAADHVGVLRLAGEWLRYGGDGAALRRLAAEDLPDRD